MTFRPLGFVRSCFGEKFGIPRQPGLSPSSTAVLETVPPFNRPEGFAGLESFSHLWVIFSFHGCPAPVDCSTWNTTVRPPRLGGNERRGVFATRSNFRPNPIGLSVVRLDRLETGPGIVRLHLSDHDLLDGTPVLDLKPYLPYADCLPQASAGFAPSAPARLPVRFSSGATETLSFHPPALRRVIEEVLSLDPRPAYHAGTSDPGRIYGQKLHGLDVRWRHDEGAIEVLEIVGPRPPGAPA